MPDKRVLQPRQDLGPEKWRAVRARTSELTRRVQWLLFGETPEPRYDDANVITCAGTSYPARVAHQDRCRVLIVPTGARSPGVLP
jgi:hypothetical protein